MKALHFNPQGIFPSSRVNSYQFMMGISLIIKSIKDWLSSALSKTITINIVSVLVFPISIPLLILGFFLGCKLRKSFKKSFSLDFDNLTKENYKVIQHTISTVGNNGDVISSLSKKKLNILIFPIIFWGFLHQFSIAINFFCNHYENCKIIVDKLDNVAPKDSLLEHLSTDKLWERRTNNYEYLI